MPKESKTKHSLKDWFLTNPLKFALHSIFFVAGSLFFYFGLNKLFLHTSAAAIRLPLFITISVFILYTIIKLVKKLPKEPMDRHSFVGIDNGLTFIYYLTVIFSNIILVKNYAAVLYLSALLSSYSVALFVTSILIAIFVYLYTVGLVIEGLYVSYKRAIFMGVPKCKAFLSLPFGITLLWLPGYILPEDKKTKKAIEIKTRWYAKLTDWIIAKPQNSIFVFLTTLTFSFFFMNMLSATLTIFMGLIFAIWILIIGKNKFVKSIGHLYSTLSVVLNIVIVAFSLWFSIWPAVKISANMMPARKATVVQTQVNVAPTQIENPAVKTAIKPNGKK